MSPWDEGLDWLEDQIRGFLRQGKWPHSKQLPISPLLWNGNSGKFEAQRTPTTFKNQVGDNSAGNVPFWTPATGKRFRLMGGQVSLSKDAACAGALRIGLYTGAVPIVQWDISAAALVATGNVITIPFSLSQNGYLANVDAILSLSLNAALTAGFASAIVWGTEE